MDRVPLLLRGLAIGFSVAAPLGPIGLLCIQRTLSGGRAQGLASGLGAATVDALYGCVAALGVGLIADLLLDQQAWLRPVGGVFLCYMGIRAMCSHPSLESAPTTTSGLAGAYVSTLLLTVSNPLTILSFSAVYGGLGLAAAGSRLSAAMLAAGVFCGSALWWTLLTGLVSLLRTRFTPDWLGWVNRLAGTLLVALGLLVITRALS